MNVHKDCEHYVEQNDMCLLYYQLGFHNVSLNYPEDYVDPFAYADNEETYKKVNNNEFQSP